MPRRSNGEGCIRKRNGKWYCEVMQGYHPDGRRNTTYLQGKTRKEVVVQYQKLRRDLDDGLDTSVDYTFGEWADIWYDNYKDNISSTTRQSHSYTLRKLNPSYFRDKFKAALTAIEGVRVLTPHSCRHTYVSQLQVLGVDLPTIQSLVGHVDTEMTQHYLHVQSPVRLDAAERFSEAFCKPKSGGDKRDRTADLLNAIDERLCTKRCYMHEWRQLYNYY